jgi:hypothetical protein
MVKGNAERIVVGAEDALIAALKVKAERPEAAIMLSSPVKLARRHASRPYWRSLIESGWQTDSL